MASEPGKLVVRITSVAWLDLDSIWEWNARAYGNEHADSYIEFLITSVEKLGPSPDLGKEVLVRPGARSIEIRRSKRGHGHIAIYRVTGQAVEVLRFFHTAQDWQNRLRDK
jgi:plasmid stabilization system protein ParE